MIDVKGDRVQEVSLDDSMLDKRVFYLLDPFGRRSYISSHSGSYVGERFCQLAPRPHVPVAEEKLGALDSVADDSGLHSHLQKLV